MCGEQNSMNCVLCNLLQANLHQQTAVDVWQDHAATVKTIVLVLNPWKSPCEHSMSKDVSIYSLEKPWILDDELEAAHAIKHAQEQDHYLRYEPSLNLGLNRLDMALEFWLPIGFDWPMFGSGQDQSVEDMLDPSRGLGLSEHDRANISERSLDELEPRGGVPFLLRSARCRLIKDYGRHETF